MPDAISEFLQEVDSKPADSIPDLIRRPPETDAPEVTPPPDPESGIPETIKRPSYSYDDLLEEHRGGGAIQDFLRSSAPQRARQALEEYGSGMHDELTNADLVRLNDIAKEGTNAW